MAGRGKAERVVTQMWEHGSCRGRSSGLSSCNSAMPLGFKRFRKKAAELRPLNWRRLKKKEFASILKEKTGLRKRVGKEEYDEGAGEESVLGEILDEEESQVAAV
ncbi:MAG: hypothetical protein SVS85_00415 [Candidatus Nanohaloarchaea archaeon]|nr:hypothetical protein [Candidatus Nanohaloarchaea archaeon]